MENMDINDVLRVVNDLDADEIINNLQKRQPQISKPFEPVLSVASDEPVKVAQPVNKVMPKLMPTLTPTNIVRTNNFQLYGYSMSYNTLYFVGAMVVIGVIIYFVTNKKKSKKENDE
uniref:Uncharacterized protein n=1 Tax=viral metagenome TaxID=1070528 RepID=A0A6C0DYX0_9ZZZZ